MAFMRSRLAVMKAAHAVARVHNVARPVYEAARPLRHRTGIDTSIPDKALSTYDGIRRAVGR